MFIKETINFAGTIWKVYSVCDERKACLLFKFLESCQGALRKDAERMVALIERLATLEKGPSSLTSDDCHLIAEKIWQFSKGGIRVAWFYDENKVIICSHGFKKEGQKTKRKDINRAEKARETYFMAKPKGGLVVVPYEEE
jgi:hypothetical protein